MQVVFGEVRGESSVRQVQLLTTHGTRLGNVVRQTWQRGTRQLSQADVDSGRAEAAATAAGLTEGNASGEGDGCRDVECLLVV